MYRPVLLGIGNGLINGNGNGNSIYMHVHVIL